MSLNVEELINRYKERAEAVKNRSIPPVGGDDRMAVSYTHLTLPTIGCV